jgi:hypothetical protein
MDRASAGEQIFYTSRYSFQGQIGCASCHIDSTFDGINGTWNRMALAATLWTTNCLKASRTPSHTSGPEPIPTFPPSADRGLKNTSGARRTTIIDAYRFGRLCSQSGAAAQSLAAGKRRVDASAGARQGDLRARGGQVQEADSGKQSLLLLPQRTQRHESEIFDVGTRKPNDNTGLLKAPLTNIALTAPYLHDGSARSLEEIWTVYNPDDKHGRTNDLTKDELNDLIEYLRTR